jgi:hypothetical protein
MIKGRLKGVVLRSVFGVYSPSTGVRPGFCGTFLKSAKKMTFKEIVKGLPGLVTLKNSI